MPADPDVAPIDPDALREARLWIDGVGCWLLWLPKRLTIGGPRPISASRPAADLALMADLSRMQAAIERRGEHYLLQPQATTALNGAPCGVPTVLPAPCEITLGTDVRLRFEIPSRLSASARVTLPSGHRPAERIEGAILMADTCLIGPQADQHVVCPGSATNLVLYRKGGQLWCRSREEWTLQGRSLTGGHRLSQGSLVSTESLTFRVELR